jgi:hypothetical protein
MHSAQASWQTLRSAIYAVARTRESSGHSILVRYVDIVAVAESLPSHLAGLAGAAFLLSLVLPSPLVGLCCRAARLPGSLCS